MYERNAIVIDRYFSNLFGYDQKNNIKNNANNYFELVEALKSYQDASDEENIIMAEFEKIASKIKDTQSKQDDLDLRERKYFEYRKILFENLDEDDITLKKEFDKIQKEIEKTENEIKENADVFAEEIKEFNDKSEIRNKCGRQRRIIENDYQKILDITIENYNNILKDKLKEIKAFLKSDNKQYVINQMKENIFKNGSKEKVPFDSNVINKAIDISLYIEGKKAEILLAIYDKTTKIISEIKNDTVKIEKHQKQVKDSKSKLDFLNVITDYIIIFLDNERMNTIGGEEEHKKIMNEACEHLQMDLEEIQNMYSLIIKEINGKSTKKQFKELYNIEYLNRLKEEERRFERDIKRLSMIGTVIYPDYWRIEGMEKIFDTFKQIMTNTYQVDLTEYEPLNITFEVKQKVLDNQTESDEIINETENEDSIKQETYNTVEDDSKMYRQDKEDDEKSEKDINNIKFDILNKDNTENDKPNNDDEDEDEEEFHWDEDDENDELRFDYNKNNENKIEEDDESEEIYLSDNQLLNSEDEEDDERDKEIDEILGLFDKDYSGENIEEQIVEDHILQIEDDDELDDSVFTKDDDEEEKKEKTKKRSLFGRRK